MSPDWAVQGLLGWVKRVMWQMQIGLGLWQTCGWQISILGQCGNSQAWGLAPIIGPGNTRGVNRQQMRFLIRAVQGLLGWVKRVLRQMQMGLWQSCGGKLSIVSTGVVTETELVPHLDCARAAGVGEESTEADAAGPGVVAKLRGASLHPWPLGQQLDKVPGLQSWARSHPGCPQGQRSFPIRVVKELLGWVKRVLWQMQMGFGLWQSLGGKSPSLANEATAG